MKEHLDLVLEELSYSLNQIDEFEYNIFVNKLLSADIVLIVAVGRVLISMKSWVKRMVHLGLNIDFVGSESEMPVGKNDLLIVASSSGESAIPKIIAKIAKEKRVSVAYLGCSPDSEIAHLSDLKLILKGKTKFNKPNEYQSKQPMSTLFEQQIYLLGDIIALDIMKKNGWCEDDIKNRHANLE